MTLAREDEEKIRKQLSELFEGMMHTLFKQEGASFNIEILADKPVQDFIEAHASVLDGSFKQVEMSDAMRRRLTRSDYIFSGMKTFHELNQAFPSLLDENGNRKTFEQFLKDVQKIDTTYNRDYLRAEYNFVQSSATMAAKWEGFMQDGDRYYLQYRTAGDDKVRPEHAALNGVTLPIDDSFWSEYYPPNGWNCFVAGTPVLTPHGWKPIEEIKKGESVIGGSGNLRIVIGTHANTVEQQLVRIITKGAVATCTENHRFLTPHGWITASNIKPGDIIIQVGKNTTLHKVINAIGNMATLCRKAFMSLIAQRKAVTPLAVDNKTNRRDEEVDHVIRGNKHILLERKSHCSQMGVHSFFGFTQWLSQCAHMFRITTPRCNAVTNGTSSYVSTMERRGDFQLFRNIVYKLAVCFSLALANVSALQRKAVVGLRKLYSGLLSTFMVSRPLRGHGFTSMTDSDTVARQNTGYRTVVHTPVLHKPAITALFHNITLFGGIGNPHAFNGFNSFLDFIRNTLFHNIYVLVEDKVTTKKVKTTVFNLSIDQDESYVVPIGITHNCRCSVVQVRKSKYPPTPHDEAMALGEEALQRDTKGMFRFNAGKEQKTVPDYNPYTIRRCNDCDIAKGKLKLAKSSLSDNELCAACQLLRKYNERAIRKLLIDIVPPDVDEYERCSDGRVLVSKWHGENERDENQRIADELSKFTGAKVYLLPRLDPRNREQAALRSTLLPDGVITDKNPDFYIGGLLFDGKSMMNITNHGELKKWKNAIENRIKSAKEQADNMIIEVPEFIPRKVIHSTIINYLNRSRKNRIIIIKWMDRFLFYDKK